MKIEELFLVEKIITVDAEMDHFGGTEPVKTLMNPSRNQLVSFLLSLRNNSHDHVEDYNLLNKDNGGYFNIREARAIVTETDIFVWNSYDAYHEGMCKPLGLDYKQRSSYMPIYFHYITKTSKKVEQYQDNLLVYVYTRGGIAGANDKLLLQKLKNRNLCDGLSKMYTG
jgi:hypothetical protein